MSIIHNDITLPILKPTAADYKKLLSDKTNFILNEWLIDNNMPSIKNWKEAEMLIKNNKVIQVWYKTASVKFAGYNNMPDWVLSDQALIDKWGISNDDVYKTYKDKIKSFELERKTAVDTYNTTVEGINEKQNLHEVTFIRENQLIAINKIAINALPLDRIVVDPTLNAEQYRIRQEKALSDYKKEIAMKYLSGNISTDELVELLK